MNHIEFSNLFDILYNNVMSNAAPGLSEYEKSVFLTKALEEIVKNYFNPKGNKYLEGLDASPKRYIDFSLLIRVANGTLNTGKSASFDKRSKVYTLPNDVFIIINESLETKEGVKLVTPITYIDYTRLMSKPYKCPPKYLVWRLMSTSSDNINIELITGVNEEVLLYKVKYVKRPVPIITIDLTSEYDGLSINGQTKISECELNPIIHLEILQRAIELAKAAYIGDITSTIQLGERSE